MEKRRIIVAMTGASGAILGIRLLQELRSSGAEIHLILSEWAQRRGPCSCRPVSAFTHALRHWRTQWIIWREKSWTDLAFPSGYTANGRERPALLRLECPLNPWSRGMKPDSC